MTNIKMYKTESNTLGLPICPAEWKGRPKYKDITTIRVACGNSSWLEFVEKAEIKPGLNTYTRVDGKPITLNGSYIVKAEDAIMMVVSYIHHNRNFSGTMGEVQTKMCIVPHRKMVLTSEFWDWEVVF